MNKHQQKRILITGIPGMGKTTIGRILESEKGFVHLDMENHPQEHQLLHLDQERFRDSIISQNKDFVITFGFYPPNCSGDILYLRSQGFDVIWLDGNREAAYRSYKARTEKQDPQNLEAHLNAFRIQLERIEKTKVIEEINPIVLNTFDGTGNFRNIAEIAEEVLFLGASK